MELELQCERDCWCCSHVDRLPGTAVRQLAAGCWTRNSCIGAIWGMMHALLQVIFQPAFFTSLVLSIPD